MRQRLGDILVQANVIDSATLQEALAEAAVHGLRVGEVLVNEGVCSEEDILGALSAQLGVDIAPLATTVVVPKRVLELVPVEIARDRQVVPMFLDASRGLLEVAMANPSDQELLDELRFSTGHQIKPLVAMPSEVEEAVVRLYFGGRAPTPHPAGGRGGPTEPMPHVRLTEPLPRAHAFTPIQVGGADRVAELEQRLDETLALLEETAHAHRVLLSLLEDRGLINVEQYRRRLEMRLYRGEADDP